MEFGQIYMQKQETNFHVQKCKNIVDNIYNENDIYIGV